APAGLGGGCGDGVRAGAGAAGDGRPGDPAGRCAGVHVRRAAGRAGPGDRRGAAAKAAHTGRIDEGADAAVVSAATAAEGDAGADRDAAGGDREGVAAHAEREPYL